MAPNFHYLYSSLEPAVRVHDLQTYRKMDLTRKCINRILELREVLLSFQTGFNLANAAVVCAVLESILGLEPSSVITEPRYLKFVTVSSFCPFTLISVLIPLVLFVISIGLLGTDLHAVDHDQNHWTYNFDLIRSLFRQSGFYRFAVRSLHTIHPPPLCERANWFLILT